MRFINIYKSVENPSMRDSIFSSLKKEDNNVYDLRIGNFNTELSYFNYLKKSVKYYIGKSYYKINIDYLRKIKSFDYAIYLMADERYWEAHEVLENYWSAANGIEKKTYQYIILLCVAGVHGQRGHFNISNSVIKRANNIKTFNSINGIDIIYIKEMFASDLSFDIQNYFSQFILNK